jgi:uncharacterized membrane protein YfcA
MAVSDWLTPDGVGLALLIFAIATLYSSVGQAGASGYIAAMGLFGVAPQVMKPSALVLNVLVAGVATFRFCRAGLFSWRVFLPLAIGSVPLAYLGGRATLPDAIYRQVVGAFLLFVAYRVIVVPKREEPSSSARTIRTPLLVLFGAAVGLLAGLTGIGGGILLTPIFLLMGRRNARESAGISAAFILVNSLAAISGCLARPMEIPGNLGWWVVAAVAGGLIGSELAIKHLAEATLRRLLALILVLTGVKLIAK